MRYRLSKLISFVTVAAICVAVYQADPKLAPIFSVLIAVPVLARHARAHNATAKNLVAIGALAAFAGMAVYLIVSMATYVVITFVFPPEPELPSPPLRLWVAAAILIFGYGGIAASMGALLGLLAAIAKALCHRRIASSVIDTNTDSSLSVAEVAKRIALQRDHD